MQNHHDIPDHVKTILNELMEDGTHPLTLTAAMRDHILRESADGTVIEDHDGTGILDRLKLTPCETRARRSFVDMVTNREEDPHCAPVLAI